MWPNFISTIQSTAKLKCACCDSCSIAQSERSQTCCYPPLLRLICWHFPILTLQTLTSAFIFSILFSIHFLRSWLRDFVQQSKASLVHDHFLYSHDLNMCLKGDNVERNEMLVTLKGQRATLTKVKLTV